MQPPFITFSLGKNEKKIRQGFAVTGSATVGTATDGQYNNLRRLSFHFLLLFFHLSLLFGSTTSIVLGKYICIN
jgi:hypothetical protein